MDLKIRQFLDELIALTNAYDDIPLEARRLALESVMYNTERAANKAIQQQNEAEAQRITRELAGIQDSSEESDQAQEPWIINKNEWAQTSMEDIKCRKPIQE